MRTYYYLKVILILVLLGGIVANADEGFSTTEDGSIIVAGGRWFSFRTKVQDADWLWLHKWSEPDDTWVPFVSTGKPIREVKISASGKYIAITDFTLDANPAAHPEYMLHIFTDEKTHVVSFADIFDIVFSPDERQVAMIVGEYREGPYMPRDIIIYNLETKESHSLNHKANEICWANHDGNIYVKWGGMFPAYCYDVDTRQLTLTNHKGIFFSPCGTYYYNCFESVIQIFRTQDNVCIMDNEKTLDYKRGVYKAEWASDGTIIFRHSHEIVHDKSDSTYPYVVELLNLCENMACRLPIDYFIGLNKKNETLIYLDEGKVRFWNVQNIFSETKDPELCRTVELR